MIEARHVGTVTVLTVHGPLTANEGDPGLRRATRDALDAGARDIVVNLCDVSAIDSSGVAALASGHLTVTNRGGRLALSDLSTKLKDIFVVTRLSTVFEVHDTEADALASLERDA